MPYSLLITDDDQDFCNLLKDVFEQADYTVTAVFTPLEALQLAQRQFFDLIITDQRMPEINGLEFIHRLRAIVPDMPIIMVSGYLDNHTIRELIKHGVGGVFMKPLNVFSLLKKTGQLIERSRHKQANLEQPAAVAESTVKSRHSLPFAFDTFPCKDPKSNAFAMELYKHRSFRVSLALIGEEGTDFVGLSRDLCRFDTSHSEEPVLLTREQLEFHQLEQIIAAHHASKKERITMVVPEADSLNKKEAAAVIQLAKKEGPFSIYPIKIRLIFCLRHDPDTLFDHGEIDEGLYLLMGTAEVKVPSLRDIKEDIPYLAEKILKRISNGTVELEPEGETYQYLQQLPWPGNYKQLEGVLRQTLNLANESVITEDYLRYVIENKPLPYNSTGAAYAKTAFEYLRSLRDEYIAATLDLAEGDKDCAARALCLPAATLQEMASSLTP
ncbi:MAG: response regulator [Verrucomicrobiota bacterium]|nr:response regulator [Verrucomicrobiota bacterium]